MNGDPTSSMPEANLATMEICLTPAAQQYLNQTRPWARFLSIILFISSGLIVLAGLALILLGMARRIAPMGSGGSGMLSDAIGTTAIGLLYFVIAILYIPPGIFLSRFAGAIRLLEAKRSSEALEDTLKHQKSFWQYAGILTIIGLIFAVFAIALALFLPILLTRR